MSSAAAYYQGGRDGGGGACGGGGAWSLANGLLSQSASLSVDRAREAHVLGNMGSGGEHILQHRPISQQLPASHRGIRLEGRRCGSGAQTQ